MKITNQVKFYTLLLLGLLFISISNAFAGGALMQKKTLPTQETKDGTIEIISGQIVKKSFVNKIGLPSSGISEYYLRASIQDYFIKFCESKVSVTEIQKFVDKGVTLEVIKKDGEWDSCDDNAAVQSRIGYYIRVIAILP